MRQETAALRDFDPADVGVGSFSTKSSNSAYELMSASTPKATKIARRRNMSRRAMCGRLRVGKKNLHFAAMVGAAMCSACLRGTHDRWP